MSTFGANYRTTTTTNDANLADPKMSTKKSNHRTSLCDAGLFLSSGSLMASNKAKTNIGKKTF
jgi:hypothetical protein